MTTSRQTTATICRASSVPPRVVVVRTTGQRAAGAEGDAPSTLTTLTGRFATFNTWAEIDSLFEGHFLERVAPGAFARTFLEDRAAMRVLFQHGRDPSVGSKPLGTIVTLREDAVGAYYEVPLFDSVPALVMDGLRAGQYGASFRFRVDRDELAERPRASAYNPAALPERTILQAHVYEFGPVTFPAYQGATAGVRSTASITDWYWATAAREVG